MKMIAQDSQLVLIDFQDKLMPAIEHGPQVLHNAQVLAQAARTLRVPIWSTEQNPSKLGANPSSWRSWCEQILPKMHFSACDEGLIECLRPKPQAPAGNARSLPKHLQKTHSVELSRPQVIVAGCEAHICLLQTALDLAEEEFEVFVVIDASGSRAQSSKDAALDRLASAGVELVTTEMVLFEWLQTAESEHFKTIQQLIV
jgi:nicotinamidase-related amidase